MNRLKRMVARYLAGGAREEVALAELVRDILADKGTSEEIHETLERVRFLASALQGALEIEEDYARVAAEIVYGDYECNSKETP